MRQALGFDEKVTDLLDVLSACQRNLAASTNAQARLELSNSLWPEKHFTLEKSFVTRAAESLGARVQPISMDAVGQKLINDTVSKATHGRIPVTLSTPPVPGTRLILINTVYFNGKWMYPFDKGSVVELPFAAPKGKIKVPFLCQTKTLPLYEGDDFSMLRLPYEGGKFEMALILPKSELMLAEFERNLKVSTLRSAIEKSTSERTRIEIPKFEFGSTIPLVAPMKGMGMKRAFTGFADFTGISKEGLFISDAFQKANVTVDEAGTVASAVTGIAMMTALPLPVKMHEFRADHPFLFLIRHISSGQILFMGRVAVPQPPAGK